MIAFRLAALAAFAYALVWLWGHLGAALAPLQEVLGA